MRLGSLRGWLLVVSLLFAMLVVGGIALTTYVIVSDGMQVVAYDTTQRVAAVASSMIRETATAAEISASQRGLAAGARRAAATSELKSKLPAMLNRSEFAETEFALYVDRSQLMWSSARKALHPAQSGQRELALKTGVPTRAFRTRPALLGGLFAKADLGATVVHMPVDLPGDRVGVLDVTFEPVSEERVIDAIRMPMAMLAISAMLIMIVLMQTSMAWVLNLVDDLRKATDSIDAGQLDNRLPEGGRNEIGDLARSLNRLIQRLQRRSEAQSRFVADASHELATPVAGIRGYTSILRAWGADDETVRAEAIDAIDRESRRMARLTSDLLNLLHADQGLRLRSERFDINGIIRERLAATASRVLDKEIEFEGPHDETVWMVGDPERAEDVISILLDNAAKYTPEGGRVSVLTKKHRDEVVVSVTDTGVGISREDVARIFDRFFRSEKARAEGESGFGLGLAIARSIVESMGGTITVDSELGQGTTFTIVLPRGRV